MKTKKELRTNCDYDEAIFLLLIDIRTLITIQLANELESGKHPDIEKMLEPILEEATQQK